MTQDNGTTFSFFFTNTVRKMLLHGCIGSEVPSEFPVKPHLFLLTFCTWIAIVLPLSSFLTSQAYNPDAQEVSSLTTFIISLTSDLLNFCYLFNGPCPYQLPEGMSEGTSDVENNLWIFLFQLPFISTPLLCLSKVIIRFFASMT